MQPSNKPKNKNARGNASQFFIAGELCRRGYLEEEEEYYQDLSDFDRKN